MHDPDSIVAAHLAAYRDAVLAKDVDAFVGLYDADVCVFDLWDDWSHDDVGAWRDTVDAWFGALGGDRVDVSFDAVVATAADGLIVARAFVVFTNVGAHGRPLRAMRNRLTWVLRGAGDAWKVVHEHTSAPIDGATFKVRFGD